MYTHSLTFPLVTRRWRGRLIESLSLRLSVTFSEYEPSSSGVCVVRREVPVCGKETISSILEGNKNSLTATHLLTLKSRLIEASLKCPFHLSSLRDDPLSRLFLILLDHFHNRSLLARASSSSEVPNVFNQQTTAGSSLSMVLDRKSIFKNLFFFCKIVMNESLEFSKRN